MIQIIIDKNTWTKCKFDNYLLLSVLIKENMRKHQTVKLLILQSTDCKVEKPIEFNPLA